MKRRARSMIGVSLFLGCAGRAVAAQASPHDTLGLRPAFRRLDAFVARHMQEAGTPGLALALVDRSGVISVRTYGFADLERRVPVSRHTRFEIGSISKSFTALALLQLEQEGRFDPARPVRSYLPWFTPASRWRPVTGHDLLTHTAGLPADRDDIPSSKAQAYMARDRTLGSAPGSRWAYSNIGYQVLGVLLETLERKPYPEVIRARLLQPLGMRETDAQFTHATRPELAVGYVSLYDDRPERPGDPLVPGTWVEYASGDGAIVSTAGDMGIYLTMLLNQGRGPAGTLLPGPRIQELMRPYAETDRGGARYGYGMFLMTADGRPLFGHSGGMIGYTSQLLGDPGLGIGAVVFVNGPGSPMAVARFALRTLGAAMLGDSLPPLPPARTPYLIPDPSPYVGTYRTPAGAVLTVGIAGDSLIVTADSVRGPLAPFGEHAFLGPRERFPLFPIRFAGDSTGMTEAWYGGEWYFGERYRGPHGFAVPAAWRAYPGHYRIMQPWEPDFRVVLRKGALWYVTPDGDEQPLTALGGSEFRLGPSGSAERLKFGDVVDGAALKATLSGMEYYRFFTE